MIPPPSDKVPDVPSHVLIPPLTPREDATLAAALLLLRRCEDGLARRVVAAGCEGEDPTLAEDLRAYIAANKT